ncbi:MAG: glycoside-pentoside-hexuronide (GPH):cation symporter, partial [Treponema sp.]|nr:glycoside-pentoside-hexuronide (GPH):cation symporter [Treponema sp.]
MERTLDGTQKSPDRIGIGEKISFGVINIGNIPIQALLNGFLMIFYTDVAGLNPAAIGTLFLLARVIDGINDPIMGFVIDHLPRTKMGRFRSYLLFGAIICCANFLLVWFGPLWAPAGKLAIAYISYLILGITFDMMDIPLNSMIPAMTDNDKERNSLSAIKGAAYMAGMMLLNMSFPLILAKASNPTSGYYTLILTGIAIVLVFTVIGVRGIRERIEPVNTEEKYKLKDIVPILASRPVLVILAVSLISGVGMFIGNGCAMYFYTYVLDNRLDVFSLTALLSFAGMLPFMILTPLFANRYGKKPVYLVGLIIASVIPLIRLINVTNIPLLLVVTVLLGIGSGLSMTLGYGLQADNVDYVEYTRKQRAEGVIASLNSFIVKAAMGIGGAIPGYILAATGYVPNQAQSDVTK